MKSRLNQLNTRLALCSRCRVPRHRRLRPDPSGARLRRAQFVSAAATLRYRVPSSPMPRTALQQPHHRQPAAPHHAVLRQRVDRVLTTRRREPARRRPQRRDHVPVQLDDDRSPRATARPDRPLHRGCPDSSDARGATPSAVLVRGAPRSRTGCRAAPGSRPGPPASRSSMTVRATWRSRRATRWRCTALPTDFETTRPILGPVVVDRMAQRVHDEVGLHCPHPLTDRGTELGRPRHPVPRRKHRARSLNVGITQSASGGPCCAGSTRSPGLPGSASAAGSRAHARGAGCSAEKSACPWPRLSLLVPSGVRSPHRCTVMPVGRGCRW